MSRRLRPIVVAAAFASFAFAGQAAACDLMRPATVSLEEAREAVRAEVAADATLARPYRYGDYWVVAIEAKAGETMKLFVHRDSGDVFTEAEAMAAHEAKVAAMKKAAAGEASA